MGADQTAVAPPRRPGAVQQARRLRQMTAQAVDLGIGEEQVAKIANTSHQQIQRLENGERRLTVDWMNRIAKTLSCRPSDLINETDETLSPRHRVILGIFDQLSPEDQDPFIKLGYALAQPLTEQRQRKKTGSE